MSKEELEEDILYDIEMQLYMEFNDDIATMYDHLGDIYSYKDIEDKKQVEQQRKIELMGNAIKQLQQENTQLKQLLENAQIISVADHRYASEKEDEVIELKSVLKEIREYIVLFNPKTEILNI